MGNYLLLWTARDLLLQFSLGFLSPTAYPSNWSGAYFFSCSPQVWEKRAREAEAAEVLVGQSQEQSPDLDPILQGDSE